MSAAPVVTSLILARVTHTHPNGDVDTSEINNVNATTLTLSGAGQHQIVLSADAGLAAGDELVLTLARRGANGEPLPTTIQVLGNDTYLPAPQPLGYYCEYGWRSTDGTITPLIHIDDNQQPQAGQYSIWDGGIVHIPPLGAGEVVAIPTRQGA